MHHCLVTPSSMTTIHAFATQELADRDHDRDHRWQDRDHYHDGRHDHRNHGRHHKHKQQRRA
ncbi:MAG TPA: hypothetical protein VFM75_00660 [Modicisalibacter sp.]|nr:hypothetical protein [Modicisalibacter sp.]